MSSGITLYSARICPWAHRVEITLKESGLDYKRFEIDLQNKPEWYAPKVNPVSKVPAIAYGGPDVDPAEPSPESIKIAESYVLIQFVADLVSSSSKPLLPATPVERAKARFFIETFTSKFPSTWYGILTRGEDPAGILPAFDVLQNLLPAEGYAVGEQWTIADAAVTPFLARTTTLLKHDVGPFEAGAGKKVWEVLQNDDKYARFRKYYADVSSRDSFKQTFFEEYIVEAFTKRFAEARAKKLAGNA